MIQGSEWSWRHTGQTLLRSHDQQGTTQELNRTVNGTAVTCAVGSVGFGGAFLGLQKLLSVIIPPLFLQQQVQPQLKVSIPWLRHQILWPLLLFILEHFTFIFTIDYKIPEDEVRFLRSKEEVKMFSLNPSVIFQQLCQNVSYYVNGCEGGTETRWRWYPAMGKWGLNKYTINIHQKEKKKMGFGSWMSFLQSAGDTGMRERSRGKRNLEGREGLWKQKQTKNWGGEPNVATYWLKSSPCMLQDMHMGTRSYPGCPASHPMHFFCPGIAVEDSPNPWNSAPIWET